MSESESLAVSESLAALTLEARSLTMRPVRSTGPTLLLGTLLTIAAMALPRMHVPAPQGAAWNAAPAQTVAQQPDADPAPSVFDQEAAMSPAQLMHRWDRLITEASRKFHVPKDWIVAVMRQESGGRTMMAPGQPIVSSAGAQGLMQVAPETYDEMRQQYGLGGDAFDPHDNIFAGAAYLRWLQGKYGYPAMFAAYNAGPGRLEDHLDRGKTLPAETRAYVGNITRALGKPASVASGVAARPLLVTFTRPDGSTIKLDANKVTAIRAPLPGEYGGAVQTVISLGKQKQAVRENLEIAGSAIRAVGGLS